MTMIIYLCTPVKLKNLQMTIDEITIGDDQTMERFGDGYVITNPDGSSVFVPFSNIAAVYKAAERVSEVTDVPAEETDSVSERTTEIGEG